MLLRVVVSRDRLLDHRAFGCGLYLFITLVILLGIIVRGILSTSVIVFIVFLTSVIVFIVLLIDCLYRF